MGSALVKQGFKPGDVVTICSPNCPEFAIMYLAAIGIGVTASAVNPVYTAGIILTSIFAFALLRLLLVLLATNPTSSGSCCTRM